MVVKRVTHRWGGQRNERQKRKNRPLNEKPAKLKGGGNLERGG